MAILLPLPKRLRLKSNSQINPLQMFSIIVLTIHFSLRLHNSDEIKNIISKLNENKSTRPNNLPSKIFWIQ